MTATQLALGIFFGLAGVEVFKVVVATGYESYKHRQMHKAMDHAQEVGKTFLDEMHESIMKDRAEEAAKAAKRRKPATKKAPVKKAPARKPVAKKAGK